MSIDPRLALLLKPRPAPAGARELLDLSPREVWVPLSEPLREAARRAVAPPFLGYRPNAGDDAVRAAAAGWLGRQRGVTVPAAEVLVAPGSKLLVRLVFDSVLRPGDEVVALAPCWPVYAGLAARLGARLVGVRWRGPARGGWDLDLLADAITDRTRLVVLTSPHLPTGEVLSPALLEAVRARVLATGAWLLADELVFGLDWREPPTSLLGDEALADRLIVLDSASKTLALSGWRVGWARVPPALGPALEWQLQHASGPAASASLELVRAALEHGDERRAEVKRALAPRRRLLLKTLGGLPGLRVREPAAGFAVTAEVAAPGADAALAALVEHGLLAVPGAAFGEDWRALLVFSFGGEPAALERACPALRAAISGTMPP